MALAIGAHVGVRAQTAPPGTGTLSGTVIDAGSREPIAGAAVSYSTDGNRTRTTLQSDAAGRFSFTGVPTLSRSQPASRTHRPRDL